MNSLYVLFKISVFTLTFEVLLSLKIHQELYQYNILLLWSELKFSLTDHEQSRGDVYEGNQQTRWMTDPWDITGSLSPARKQRGQGPHPANNASISRVFSTSTSQVVRPHPLTVSHPLSPLSFTLSRLSAQRSTLSFLQGQAICQGVKSESCILFYFIHHLAEIDFDTIEVISYATNKLTSRLILDELYSQL